MFYGSDNGGHTAAVLTSFIATCKHLRIDPFAYLRDILDRINAHPHDRLDDTRQMGRRTCCRSPLTTLLPQTRLHRTLKMESQDGYHQGARTRGAIRCAVWIQRRIILSDSGDQQLRLKYPYKRYRVIRKRVAPFVLITLSSLTIGIPLFAHHGTSGVYDCTHRITTKATVAQYIWANPPTSKFTSP